MTDIVKRGLELFAHIENILALPEYLALIAGVQPTQNAQKRGLTTAIAPLHLHEIASIETKVQTGKQYAIVPLTKEGSSFQQ